LLEESFTVMSRSRGQIRRPNDSLAQMTISLVDTHGAVLGIVRGPDAPVFGTDVSLQKARTAAFFSNPRAASDLAATNSPSVGMFLANARTFFGSSNIFTGQHAWTTRAISNISRPYFPDGEVGRAPGPFSRDINGFNPFSTGLQSALIVGNVNTHVGFLLGRNPDTPARCTTMPDATTGQNGLVQARAFAEAISVTGIALTKLDGSAKGGIVVAIQNELSIPIKLVGVGEGVEDFAFFDPEEFANGLVA
jgi:hypothetical protein